MHMFHAYAMLRPGIVTALFWVEACKFAVPNLASPNAFIRYAQVPGMTQLVEMITYNELVLLNGLCLDLTFCTGRVPHTTALSLHGSGWGDTC
jgi:hypothetical protein